MCIRDRIVDTIVAIENYYHLVMLPMKAFSRAVDQIHDYEPVSYTHLRAHETVLDLVCRLLLEKKNTHNNPIHNTAHNNQTTNIDLERKHT